MQIKQNLRTSELFNAWQSYININYLIVFLITCFIGQSQSVLAQNGESNKEPKTLFKNYDDQGLRLSTFYVEIAPKTAFSNIGDKLSSFAMIEAGIHLNRKFSLGYYMASSPKTTLITVPTAGTPEYQRWIDSGVRLQNLPTGQTQAYLYFGHHGFNFGYLFRAHNVLFPRAAIKVGRGVLEMTADQKSLFQFFKNSLLKEKIWDFKPEIGLGINLRPWWRIHVDVGYQFLLAGNTEIIDSGSLDGVSFELGFGFGAFNR